MKFEYLFWAFFIAIFANMVWKYFRNGRSLTGAMLGGRIKHEISKIELTRGPMPSQVLHVMAMESSEGEYFVGLSLVSKAPLGASMIPYRLNASQAQKLIVLLQRAVRE